MPLVRWATSPPTARALAQAFVLQADASPYDRACLASIAGDTEGALALLAEALAVHPDQKPRAKDDPDLRWLRNDDRSGRCSANRHPTRPAHDRIPA